MNKEAIITFVVLIAMLTVATIIVDSLAKQTALDRLTTDSSMRRNMGLIETLNAGRTIVITVLLGLATSILIHAIKRRQYQKVFR